MGDGDGSLVPCTKRTSNHRLSASACAPDHQNLFRFASRSSSPLHSHARDTSAQERKAIPFPFRAPLSQLAYNLQYRIRAAPIPHVWFGCFGSQARVKMAEDGYSVKLHIYDLSQGMARQLSTTILGKAIEAIWHTGVVVYGREYYFGGGIRQDRPGRTPYGTPIRVEDLGVTHVPEEVFEDFLEEISPRYTPATYNLLSNNCNNFSNEAVQFLVGSTIPSYILELPNEVMNSPVGALILPMIQGLETTLRAGAVPQPPQFRPAPAATQMQPSSNNIQIQSRSAAADKTGPEKTTGNDSGIIPPAVQPAPAAAQVSKTAASSDPLRQAKNRVQEEIKREFAAIMATGTVQAGEAAALATRRVMERHGLQRAAAMQRG